jgi:hypothetical protein
MSQQLTRDFPARSFAQRNSNGPKARPDRQVARQRRFNAATTPLNEAVMVLRLTPTP